MTIQNQNRRVSYLGDGSTTVFSYTFRIQAEGDITVVLQSSAGVDTVQTITTNYTVAGVGDAGGGSITMLTAPASGETLSIFIDPDLTQLTDYSNGGEFQAQSHEDALDKTVNIDKRSRDLVERALTLQDGDVDGSGQYDANSNKITNLANASAAGDAVNQSTMDAAITAAQLMLNTGVIEGSGSDYLFSTLAYVLADTGAVNRRLTDRMGDVLNVKDFGATGDGSTDDALNIQQAIDALEARGGGILYFPPGTYIVGTALTVQREIILMGAGRGQESSSANPTDGVSVIRAQAASAIAYVVRFQSATSGNYLYGGGIENLVIDGNNTAVNGLEVNSCSEWVARNLLVFRPTGIGLYMSDANSVPCMRPVLDNVWVSCGANAAAASMIGVVFDDVVAAQGGVVQCYVTRLITLTDDGNGFELRGSDNANVEMFQGFILTGGTGKSLLFKNGTHFEPRNHRFGWVNTGQSGGGQGTIEAESNAFGIVLEHINAEDTQLVVASGAQLSYKVHDNVTGAQYRTLEYQMSDERALPLGSFQAVSATSGVHASLWDCLEFSNGVTEVAAASLGQVYEWEDGEITGVKLTFAMDSANTSDDVRLRIRVLSAAEGEATATPQGDESFTVSVNDTANRIDVHEVTFTTAVAFTRGDFVAVEVGRLGADAADTATGDMDLLGVSLVYQATGPAGGSQGPWGVTAPQV